MRGCRRARPPSGRADDLDRRLPSAAAAGVDLGLYHRALPPRRSAATSACLLRRRRHASVGLRGQPCPGIGDDLLGLVLVDLHVSALCLSSVSIIQRDGVRFWRRSTPTKNVGPFVLPLAEGVGFEPTFPFGIPVFKTGALSRSATPPYGLSLSASPNAAIIVPHS